MRLIYFDINGKKLIYFLKLFKRDLTNVIKIKEKNIIYKVLIENLLKKNKSNVKEVKYEKNIFRYGNYDFWVIALLKSLENNYFFNF